MNLTQRSGACVRKGVAVRGGMALVAASVALGLTTVACSGGESGSPVVDDVDGYSTALESGAVGLTRAEAVAMGLDPDMDLQATVCQLPPGAEPLEDDRPPRVYFGAMNRELARYPELAVEFGADSVSSCEEAERFIPLSNSFRDKRPEEEVPPAVQAAGSELIDAADKIAYGAITYHPGLVVLNNLGSAGNMTCTGFLVSSRHVMTAAHCLNGTQNDSAVLTSVSGSTWSGAVFTYVHPDYSGQLMSSGSGTDSYDDVGLIVLQASSWSFANVAANRFRLWAGSTSNGQLLDVYGGGWTVNSAGTFSIGTLRGTADGSQIDIDSHTGSGYFLNYAPAAGRMCSGDSGGPAIRVEDVEVAYGVHSASQRGNELCTPIGNNQVWTKVSPKVIWAEASMRPMFGAGFSCNVYNNGWGNYYRCW